MQVQEDIGLVQQVKSFFIDHHPPQPPKPALSEHSTSNPATSSDHPRFHSPTVPNVHAPVNPPVNPNQIDEEEEEEEEDEEDEEEEEEEGESESEADTGRNSHLSGARNPRVVNVAQAAAEPSELMQLEMSEDIRLGSPDDGSNNLDSEFQLLAASQGGNAVDHQRRADSYRAESTRRWPLLQDPMSSNLQPPPSGMSLAGISLSLLDYVFQNPINGCVVSIPNMHANLASMQAMHWGFVGGQIFHSQIGKKVWGTPQTNTVKVY